MKAMKIVGIGFLLLILLLLPLAVRNSYYVHLLITVGINAVLAMTFILMLRTGLLSLGIAAFWGIGAYSSAFLSVRAGLAAWAALPLAVAITGIVAIVFGALLVKQGGLGFIIQTLALGFIVVLVFGTFKIFGGHVGIIGIPHPESIQIPFSGTVKFTSISKTPFYYLMLICALLSVLTLTAFYSSWAGRAWRAIGLSPDLAQSLGINIFRYRLIAFVIACLIAGLMGSFYAHYCGVIVPDTFGPFKTIYVHVYAILGGIDFAILGPIVGAFVMTFVPEMLRVTEGIEPIITGILIILLILFLPSGLLGLLHMLKKGKTM